MPSFADLLRDHMKKTDMNPDALAQRIGLSHDTITRWMTGKEIPTLHEYVIFCAEALNLDSTEYDEFLEAVPFSSFATLLNKEMKKAKFDTAKLAKSLNISEDIVKKTPNTRAYAVAYAKTLGLKPIDQEQFVAAAGFPPKKALSPCVVGLPIQNISQFFGREDELKRIANLWNSFPLQNIAVIGSKGVGKSSLLNYLVNLQNTVAEDLRPNQRHDWFANLRKAQWAKLDFNNALIWTKEGFFRNLLKRLNIKENDGLHFIDMIDQHLDIPTFILLDNVDVGLSSPELDISFWSSLRSLTEENENLAFMITSPKVPELEAKIYGKPSPFFNIFGHVIKLEPLQEEDARELLYFGADQAQLSVPCKEEDIAWILEQSGRWPILLQILCDCRFQALREGKLEAVWKKQCLGRLSDLSGFKNLTGL